MPKLRRILAGLALAILAASALPAQAQWQVCDHCVPIGNGAGTGFAAATPGTAGIPLVSSGASTDPVFSTALVVGGGTGITSYAVGDILYASASTTLSKLAGVATGNALISGGVTTAPSWGKIGLTTHISGTLAVGNGGTNCSVASGTCLDNITGFSSTGILARTASGTYAFRTITGTSAEITVTNGDGVSGNPTLSIPTAVTFTGKTITGGTYSSPTINTPTITGGTHTGITSFSLDDTASAFNLVMAATVTGMTADRTITWDVLNGSRTITLAGNVTTAANFITSGAFALTLTATGTTNATFPAGTVILASTGANAFTDSQTITLSQNGETKVSVTNANTGTGAFASHVATNANGNATFGVGGANFTTNAILQNRAFIAADSALAGIVINNVGDDPTLFGRSNTEIARFPVSGGVTFNVGVTGTSTGSIGFSGGTSGTATVTAAAAAGSATLTLGTTTGTLAVSANNLSFFAATTSAQLAGVISDETGTAGKLVFDTSPTFQTSVVITNNATTVTPPTGAVLHLSAANSANAIYAMDSYAAFGVIMVRRANGSAASPTGLVAEDVIGGFNARGYTSAGAYTTANNGAVIFVSTETWSSTANGTRIDFYTTANTTTSLTRKHQMDQNGAFTTAMTTAIPAGGTAGVGYLFSSTANYGIFFGSGAPSLSAAKGSLYLRSDGSATNNRAYINTDGGTTWTPLTTGA